jgi:tRNA dimethylallyltransferase
MPRAALYARIERRARDMFANGLVEEVRGLRQSHPSWSETARQAVGYKEAGGVLDGQLSEERAIESTVLRTRRLAKRQMTWFRHQADIDWVRVTEDDAIEDIAERVQASWSKHGPTDLRI